MSTQECEYAQRLKVILAEYKAELAELKREIKHLESLIKYFNESHTNLNNITLPTATGEGHQDR